MVKLKKLQKEFLNLGYTVSDEDPKEGGEGTVYKAEKGQNLYAIKVIKDLRTDRIKRYKQEIESVQKLNHHNIIKPIYGELLIDGGEVQYSIMPFYENDLKKIIPQLLDYEQIFNIIIELGEALKYIHSKGIIHRDLKPENVLVAADDGHLVLTDFGIAHFKDSNLTKKNDLLNNRVYLAPEQYIKGNAQNVTQAADIYSFGLIINECFTKRVAHGDNPRLISDEYPFLFELDNIVKKMLRQDAEKRIGINCALSLLKEARETLFEDLDYLSCDLTDGSPEDLSPEELGSILSQASKDVYFATKFKLDDDITKQYELNYHKNISFSVSPYLKNLAAGYKILDVCRKKFIYETAYPEGPRLSFLNESEYKGLHDRLEAVLNIYMISGRLYGQIKKYFSACLDYHAEEILTQIEDEQWMFEKLFYHIEDAPILWLRTFLLELGIEQSELEDNIFINWDRAVAGNEIESSLYIGDTAFDKKQTENIKLICQELTNRWDVSYDYLDDKTIRFIFADEHQFENFKRYVKSVTKSGRNLVLDFNDDISQKSKVIDGEIIVDLNISWDIDSILAKALDFKKIN